MRILVTGADGFVGGHLLRTLVREGAEETFAGYHLAGAATARLPIPAANQLALDVTDPASVEAAIAVARPDRVFHLAAQSSVGRSLEDPLGTWAVNATGTLVLAEALRRAGRSARLLVVSSAEVYGPVEDGAVSEDLPLRPTTPYGASKAAAEMAALQASRAGALEVIVSRSFNHTGPGQDERFVLPSMARQLARIRAGLAEPVLRVGNLAARRDFLDVRDVVAAYLTLIERGTPGRVYNVCSGVAHSLREVVARLVEISETGASIEVDPARLREVDIPVLYGSAERLRGLGWEPEIDLDRTLRDLFDEAVVAAAGEAQ